MGDILGAKRGKFPCLMTRGLSKEVDWVFDMSREYQFSACRLARSQKKAPCPNKRAAMGSCLRVALPEAKRAIGAP